MITSGENIVSKARHPRVHSTSISRATRPCRCEGCLVVPARGRGGMSAPIVAPPPDVATIIEKTASFVARNGPEFEERIKKEQNSVKFSFL